MKIGITGATGQLGQLVVNELKKKTSADNLVALVRSVEKATELGVETRVFDYNNPDAAALSGLDKLLLISASEIGKRVEQHQNVIDAAKKAGVPYIVYTSLLHADKSSIGLAAEHVATEAALKDSGIAYTFLRNGWYTENYTASAQGVVAHGTVYGAAGDGKISAASRQDFAEACAVVLTSDGHQGKIYELAGDVAFTMTEYAAELAKQAGKDIPYVNLDVEGYGNVLKQVGLPDGFADFLAITEISIEKGDLYNDSHDLSQLIGRPTTSLAEVIKKALA